MAASAARVSSSTDSAPPAPRRRIARWKPPVALAAVVLGLVGGQALSLGVVAAFGGDEASVWDGIGLLLGREAP